MKKLLLLISISLVASAAFGQTPTSNYNLPYRTQTRMLQILQKLPNITSDSVLVTTANGWVGSAPFPNWARLDGKPSVFASDIANVSGLQVALDGKLGTSYIPSWTSINGKPSFFSGSYLDLTNVPSLFPTNIANISGLQAVLDGKQSSGSYLTTSYVPTWSSISGKPTFATVATSGNYGDLYGLPTIPTNNNQLTNGSGYLTGITSGQVTTALGFTPASTTQLDTKQNTLVSGTNIKTINGNSLLGSGDVYIAAYIGPTITTPTIVFGTSYQAPSNKNVWVNASVTHTIALTLLLTSGSSLVQLQTSPNNSTWTTINSAGYSDGVAVAVALNKTVTNNISGEVQPNYYWRLVSTVTGAGSNTIVNQQLKTY